MATVGWRTAKVAAAVPRDTVCTHDDIVFSNDVHQNNKFEWFLYSAYFKPCRAEETALQKKQNYMSKNTGDDHVYRDHAARGSRRR